MPHEPSTAIAAYAAGASALIWQLLKARRGGADTEAHELGRLLSENYGITECVTDAERETGADAVPEGADAVGGEGDPVSGRELRRSGNARSDRVQERAADSGGVQAAEETSLADPGSAVHRMASRRSRVPGNS